MNIIRSRLSRVFILALLLVMMPVFVFGTTKTMKNSEFTEFDIGTNYNLTVKMGDVITIFKKTYDGSELTSVTSSNKKAATASLDGSCIDLKAKFAGKTKVTIKDDEGRKTLIYVTVKQGKSTIESYNWIYKNTKTVTVDATNVVKGDKIKLKIGNKTYTKKVTKTAKKKRVKIKITKPGFYGKAVTLKLVRKGKTVAKGTEYVYLSDTVYVGYTKKTVKWLTGWNDPVKKVKSANAETWYYDWDEDGVWEGSLFFRNGKVSNWSIVE